MSHAQASEGARQMGSPVILPANSGCRRCTCGNRRSPSICFCCSGAAAASMAVVRLPPSWPGTTAEVALCWAGAGGCWGGGGGGAWWVTGPF